MGLGIAGQLIGLGVKYAEVPARPAGEPLSTVLGDPSRNRLRGARSAGGPSHLIRVLSGQMRLCVALLKAAKEYDTVGECALLRDH
jgi:hypothetical protein